jgi:hypothetical protein
VVEQALQAQTSSRLTTNKAAVMAFRQPSQPAAHSGSLPAAAAVYGLASTGRPYGQAVVPAALVYLQQTAGLQRAPIHQQQPEQQIVAAVAAAAVGARADRPQTLVHLVRPAAAAL